MGKRRRYSIGLHLGVNQQNLLVIGVSTKMEEDITTQLYVRKADGKKDYTKPSCTDITNGFMKMVTNFMTDIIERRVREYDSSKLIDKLIEKLPTKLANKYITK